MTDGKKELIQEEKDKIFPIRIERNICSRCGKEYDQPALITQFGCIIARACPECVDKYDIAEKSKEKHIKEQNKLNGSKISESKKNISRLLLITITQLQKVRRKL